MPVFKYNFLSNKIWTHFLHGLHPLRIKRGASAKPFVTKFINVFHYRTLFLKSVRYTVSLVSHMQESNAYFACNTFKKRHDKTNKTSVRPEKTRSAWASAQSDQSSLSAGRYLGSLAAHWAYSEDPDQSRRMPRLIWVFVGRTLILLVLSCRGSIFIIRKTYMLQFLVSRSLRLVMSKPVFRSVSPGKT